MMISRASAGVAPAPVARPFRSTSVPTWTPRKVEHLVKRVRERLAAQGVDGLVPEPGSTGYDSAYWRNLIDALVDSGTLGAPDLRLLRFDDE